MKAPSRRGLLGSVAALAPLAAAGAVIAPAAASTAHPDAALIATCAQHIANFHATAQVDGDKGPEWDAYYATMDAITVAKPVTVAGLAAKARVALLEATNPDGTVAWDGSVGSDWAGDLVHDLIRVAGGAA